MKGRTVKRFIEANIEKIGTRLPTDKSRNFEQAEKLYDLHSVDHHRGEYVRGDIHVNSMENCWSHSKRSITGAFKGVSKKHAQSYWNAFVFHYNNRYNDRKRFETLLRIVLLSATEQKTWTSS